VQGRVHEVEVDLSTDTGPAELVAAALEQGPVDILINNAGAVTPRLNGFVAVTDDQWWTTLTLTLMAIRTTRAILPHARRRARRHRQHCVRERVPARRP
jgi:NAD(P)-dependent dehydrogenase (short-subunit alcohol dehydrogenase family)